VIMELNLYPVLPETLLLCAVSVLLIGDLFVSDANRHLSYWFTQLTLLACAAVTLATWQSPDPRSAIWWSTTGCRTCSSWAATCPCR
jgi:NADH:ubiquinone oxidoreductase subunit 2 (subunit N)